MNTQIDGPYFQPLEKFNFLVVEGPAGSGKTTLISRLTEDGFFLLPPAVTDFKRPRTYDGERNLALSIVKDSGSILSTAIYRMIVREWELVGIPLIDRWAVSQMVYGRIRRGMNPSMDQNFISAVGEELHAELSLVKALYRTMISRDGFYDRFYLREPLPNIGAELREIAGLFPKLNIMIAVVLPSLKLLTTTRGAEFEKTRREYPFDPSLEIRMYSAVMNAIIRTTRHLPNNVFLHCLTIPCDSYADLDFAPVKIRTRYAAVIGG